MLGETLGIVVCVLPWFARAYVASKYRIRQTIAGKRQWAWKRGTPDWVIRVIPRLESAGWAALLGFMVWWVLHPVPALGAIVLVIPFVRQAVLGVFQPSLTIPFWGLETEGTGFSKEGT